MESIINKVVSITNLVKPGNMVHFVSYRQGFFTYRVVTEQGEAWEFPVPLDDIGTATLMDMDKAITYMRWIRKALQDKTLIKK